MNAKGLHVIVTGGSGGIGQSIAKAFLTNGAEVLIIGRRTEVLQKAKEFLNTFGAGINFLEGDVSLPNFEGQIRAEVSRRFGGVVDVLVNAAGIYGPMGSLEENDIEIWKKTFEVNVFGTMLMCRAAIPFMKARGAGRIINFSGGGDGAFPNFTAYSASKGAVVRFTESLAAELKPFGIFVNAIAPGAVNSQLLQEVLKAGPSKVGKEFYERSLAQKQGGGVSPDLAAELILFLASPAAEGLSGKVFSAVYDKWREFADNKDKIASTDIYNLRRIKPKDRGYDF